MIIERVEQKMLQRQKSPKRKLKGDFIIQLIPSKDYFDEIAVSLNLSVSPIQQPLPHHEQVMSVVYISNGLREVMKCILQYSYS